MRITSSRTHLQREADLIDCQLARLVSRLEELERKIPRDHRISAARYKLRSARPLVRAMMHKEDQETTLG